MKLLTLATVLMTAGTLAACGSKSSDNNNGGGAHTKAVADFSTLQMVNDDSTCGSGPVVASVNGNWGMTLASANQDFTMTGTLSIHGNQLTATNVCTFLGRTLVVGGSTPISVDRQTIQVLGTVSDSQAIDETDYHLDCYVDLKPSSMSYKAYGSCLKVTDEKGKEIVLHAVGNPPQPTSSQSPSQPTQPQPSHSQPVPQPAPQPNQPMPVPTAQPMPAPQPAGQWACMIDNRSTNDVYIGYGASQFAANALAKQSCKAGADNYYCNEPTMVCGQQEFAADAYFCEVDNRSSGEVYTATGHSEAEATYQARKSCFNSKSEDAFYCAKGADVKCVKQR